MNIDELAHALGVVFCRAPCGDLDLAPGTMHVQDDEEIDGAVAVVFVIVAFELARLGRDGLAHLADELDWAFIEADDWSLGIRRFGVEIAESEGLRTGFRRKPDSVPMIADSR